MLRSTKSIPKPSPIVNNNSPSANKTAQKKPGKLQPVSFTEPSEQPAEFVSDMDKSLTAAIGVINPKVNTHYYSFGNFNLVRLIMYIIKQTGPVNLSMTSYSFSSKSIQQLQNHIENEKIISFKLILDNRVRSISPKPFQIIASCFNYRCTSVHAKIALLWNDNWKLSIVTSQNATDNPKMERGIIFTDPAVFDFDFKNFNDAFLRGTA
ncbi:MAG: hypothetical protein ACOYN4_18155 [Bacteroidales bacterium]